MSPCPKPAPCVWLGLFPCPPVPNLPPCVWLGLFPCPPVPNLPPVCPPVVGPVPLSPCPKPAPCVWLGLFPCPPVPNLPPVCGWACSPVPLSQTCPLCVVGPVPCPPVPNPLSQTCPLCVTGTVLLLMLLLTPLLSSSQARRCRWRAGRSGPWIRTSGPTRWCGTGCWGPERTSLPWAPSQVCPSRAHLSERGF